MSTAINNYPAFPTTPENMSSCGMSLRDYFAAHVSVDPGMVVNILLASGKEEATADEVAKIEATIRYNKADAMLAAREAA